MRSRVSKQWECYLNSGLSHSRVLFPVSRCLPATMREQTAVEQTTGSRLKDSTANTNNKALSPYAKVAGSILSQGTYKNQPMNVLISGTKKKKDVSLSPSPSLSLSLKSINF